MCVLSVCPLPGPVPLLLQSLAGGFTGHFTASRQPMATGKSAGPQSRLSVFTPGPLVLQSTRRAARRCTAGRPDSWAAVPDPLQDQNPPVLVCFYTLY